MSRGYVYILTNPCMPGIVKIGKTTGDPETRAAQLYQTGVPLPFEVAHSVYAPNCHALETEVHSRLPDLRVSDSREFFRVCCSIAADILDDCLREMVDEWLSDFIADQAIVHVDLMVCQAQIHMLASETGEPPPLIADALSEITAEELLPAIRRVYDRLERFKLKRQDAGE
jgi:hypothetical protein